MNPENVLIDILALLSAAVITIPVFHRLGLGSVLGYLTAGAILGPWGIEAIVQVAEIRQFAEFGIVFLLFLIGIEMKPERLWVMRRLVFGLGLVQVLITAGIITSIALLLQIPLKSALITGFGLALSSTAFGLQVMAEKGEITSVTGRTAFSILLLQDLAVVPLLAMVSFLTEGIELEISMGTAILEAVLAIVCVVISGRYLLNPILNSIASCRNSEIFIAAAVLLVLGVASLMELVGLSRALGAFLAGLMLAESHYRHQIEADIQPFRGILLGLFFMSVGMSVDFGLLIDYAWQITALCISLMLVKALIIWSLCITSGISQYNSVRTAALLSQAGEFGFVLFGFATLSGIMSDLHFQLLTLVIAMSMIVTPLLVKLGDLWVKQREVLAEDAVSMRDMPDVRTNFVILAGFGRVGQRIASLMHSANISYVALDYNQQLVTDGRIKGFPVYYGDARRLTVLKAAGADRARMLVVTLDNPVHAENLVSVVRQHYPLLPIHVRSQDRRHSKNLLFNGADNAVSETLEASLRLSEIVLDNSGFSHKHTIQLLDDYRKGYYRKLKEDIRGGRSKETKTS